MLIAGCNAGGFGESAHVCANVPRGDVHEFARPVFLSPRQKLLHGVHVGAARIFIANGAEEEFMRGEARVCPGAMKDGGQGFNLPAYGIIPELDGESRGTSAVTVGGGHIRVASIRPGHRQVLLRFEDFRDRQATEWTACGISPAVSPSLESED